MSGHKRYVIDEPDLDSSATRWHAARGSVLRDTVTSEVLFDEAELIESPEDATLDRALAPLVHELNRLAEIVYGHGEA